MSMLREAAQQALEVLEMLAQPTKTNSETPRYKAHKAAITALRAALAQQDEPKGGGKLPPPLQAEPVANASSWFALVMNAAAEIEDASHCLRDEAAKRVAISWAKHYRDAANALFAATPRREWQRLTNEEMYGLYRRAGLEAYYPRDGLVQGDYDRRIDAYARAIETKLKEKNA